MNFRLRFIPLVMVVGVMGVVLVMPVAGQSQDGDTHIHLPFVAQTQSYGAAFAIQGRAVLGGNGQAEVILTLDFFDGVTTTARFTTTTTRAGRYAFTGVPLLESGQNYRVSYYNGAYGNPNREDTKTSWQGFPITSSIPHTVVNAGFIELDRLALEFPTEGRQYAFTYPVEWNGGNIIRFYDGNGVLQYQSPDLGNTGDHIFYPLPPELNFDTPYLWEPMVISEKGEIGIDTQARREMTFVYLPPLERPSNLNVSCTEPSPYTEMASCTFEWDPVPGATEYYVSGRWRVNEEWMAETGLVENLHCGSNFEWTVKARNETAEGYWQNAIPVMVSDCPCDHPACLGDNHKQQSEWQPDQREPY